MNIVSYLIFIVFRTGGRYVSRGRQTTPRRVERHYAHVATTAGIHAQRARHASGQIPSCRSDFQRRLTLCLRRHAKHSCWSGTSCLGSGPRTVIVFQGL